MAKKINAVLFDLDGTLLDTVGDLTFTLNELRKNHQLPDALEIQMIRPLVSKGLKAMLKLGLEIDENHPTFEGIRDEFLQVYHQHLADSTNFFHNMDKVLDYLESENIPWGIVTNKMTKYTLRLLKALSIDHRPICIVCGDTVSKFKPDPEPILHACELLKCSPQNCLFIGDSINDIIASKAAGMRSLAALYGYIAAEDDPYSWGADGYIEDPIEIIDWVKRLRA